MILTHYDMSFWVWDRFLASLVAFSPAHPDPHTRTPFTTGALILSSKTQNRRGGDTITCHHPSSFVHPDRRASLTCDLCTTNPGTRHRSFKKATLTLCPSCNDALETISHEENCTIQDAYKIAIERIYQHILEPVGLTPKRVKRLTQK